MRCGVLLVFCLSSGASIGQDSVNHGTIELMDYLAGEHTRNQLEFSETQTKEFEALQKEYGQAVRKMYTEFPELKQKDLPSKARQEMIRKVRLAAQKLRKEFSEKANDILVPQQFSMISKVKFKQTVQAFGFAYAVSNSSFRDQLKTTEEQKKELAKIRAEAQQAIQKQIAEMRAEAKKKMLKVFNSQQREKLKELEGKTPTTPKL